MKWRFHRFSKNLKARDEKRAAQGASDRGPKHFFTDRRGVGYGPRPDGNSRSRDRSPPPRNGGGGRRDRSRDRRDRSRDRGGSSRQGWKKPVFLKKTQPSGFFWFFWFFFLFFYLFFGVLWFFLYICPEERVFRFFF
jgi:hypothetical protein